MLYVVKSKMLRDVKERQQKIVLVKREVQRVPLRSAETDIESTLCSFCVMEAKRRTRRDSLTKTSGFSATRASDTPSYMFPVIIVNKISNHKGFYVCFDGTET